MENKKIIIGNMKMNLTLNLVNDYITKMKKYDNVIICPSSIYIPYFIEAGYKVGIQDISEYGNGAHTGEISISQAQSIGIEYVIVGHSERRINFHETDDVVREKLKKVVSNNMCAILCVGETLSEKNTNVEKDKIKYQLSLDLHNIEKEYYKNIIIGYEPIWAIGTGKIPKYEEIEDMINFIKETISSEFGFVPPVLYGGSVDDKNIEQLKEIKNIDGFLVGGICLFPNKFINLIEAVN